MPIAAVNGIKLGYAEFGAGEPLVLVTGTGAPGRVWQAHQVPALTAAGYRVITVDNRGVPPTEAAEPFTLADMVADIAGLIEFLDAAPCRIVGFSLGGMIVQELLAARPDLVSRAVLMATRGRSDVMALAMSAGETELHGSGIELPPRYAAAIHATHYLSPRTLSDEQAIGDWLELFEMTSGSSGAVRAQLGLEMIPNRLDVYRGIKCPCLVVAFEDDLIVRPHLCREVADAIPGSAFVTLPGCGHYGYLEDPAAVNAQIIGFFGDRSRR
ncbi:alpha/beta fold hydrolase [Actinomadura rayongensis]|uniref:Alpha/beta fold hydrolase n=1 Tax=Actinomadura rayongensis TaxID=1429076 RepID=A0A6I4W9U3_9ACTN|nr:alpha/beta hydrolase [Actinomadura rayongensis]MXQ65550.1 alpha/beta fold hydrolase [Actinomadura rayongensis]